MKLELHEEITLPLSIRLDRSLPPGAKLLFADIKAWLQEGREVEYDLETLAKTFKVCRPTIKQWISFLCINDYLSVVSVLKENSFRQFITLGVKE